MNKVKIFLLMASMVFAVIFAFSCSSNNSPELVAQSSSSEDMAQSSSSEWTAQSSSSEGTAHSSSSKWTAQSSSSEEMVQSSSSEWTAQSSSSETSSVSLCAGEEYDPDIFRCEYGELVGKCAGRDYYPAYQICDGGVIKNKNEPSSSSELSLPSSSSSSIPSSSSIVPSSSSVAVSSSSSMPSSSSSACTAANNTQTHYCSNGTIKEYGFVDYGGQRYKTVEIGEQVWFAENLNYNPGTGNSACYSNQTSNCTTYGRLYNWVTAMSLSSNCNSSICLDLIQQPHRGICPSGWHIPSYADYDKLYRFVMSGTSMRESSNNPMAGKYLKSATGWNDNQEKSGNGTDDYGFSALPGGNGYDGNFDYVGNFGYWWSASEHEIRFYALRWRIYYYHDDVGWLPDNKPVLASVRCLQD